MVTIGESMDANLRWSGPGREEVIYWGIRCRI